MIKVEKLTIKNIPAILWGDKSSKLIIAVHGKCASKIDNSIWILAEEAVQLGYQVLSFDLPQHGERVYETEPCMVQNCVKELGFVMEYAKQQAEEIYLFANSMGAYFSLLSYKDERIKHTWFLSPVVNMLAIIQSMMSQMDITEEQLREKGVIDHPMEPLYWEYYCYVKEHPILKWQSPTSILRGEYDTLCEYSVVSEFAKQFECTLEEQKGGEHWFHTAEQLAYYRKWLQAELKNQ